MTVQEVVLWVFGAFALVVLIVPAAINLTAMLVELQEQQRIEEEKRLRYLSRRRAELQEREEELERWMRQTGKKLSEMEERGDS